MVYVLLYLIYFRDDCYMGVLKDELEEIFCFFYDQNEELCNQLIDRVILNRDNIMYLVIYLYK